MHLGRREPTDYRHVERYTLAAPIDANVPVVMGTVWLQSMDNPARYPDGRWWICREQGWQNRPSRGDHAYCLEPAGGNDAWWPWHNQQRGSCTGHSAARAAELTYRTRFDPEAWYDRNQQIDEYADTPPEEGSSLRAAFDAWREGRPAMRGKKTEKLKANRWATSADDVLKTLGHDGAAPILQSWGRTWAHRVWIPGEALDWLLERGGEAGVPVF
jgi:hypothetical protein